MKIRHKFNVNGKEIETTYTHIPFRYILAMLITVLEIVAIIGIVVLLCYYVPYFYISAILTQIACIILIISSDDNPDYKAPWLLCVMVLPIAGFMLYFMFYSRNINKKYVKRFKNAAEYETPTDPTSAEAKLSIYNPRASGQARLISNSGGGKLYYNSSAEYLNSGEALFDRLIADLRAAEHFIFMEYFIIEDGVFWGSILDVLRQKAADGVEVRIVYDDIGCMNTLPGNYFKTLRGYGIKAVSFSMLKGQADGEFNNRSHRKITVIDGKIGYTGGINLADEYINKKKRFGHWKDTAIRITGDAVNELTKLFLTDYYINSKEKDILFGDFFVNTEAVQERDSYILPFGDGPKPLYKRRVSHLAIRTLISDAREYVYITTPYLIIDNDLCATIEAAALRGVSVHIILPHVPDKRIVFEITRSFYNRLIDAGVHIYEYTPGFIHSKLYIADGDTAIIGTMNLDYRSLVHHYENGVWLHGCECIGAMVKDYRETMLACQKIVEAKKPNPFLRLIRAVGRIFAPLM